MRRRQAGWTTIEDAEETRANLAAANMSERTTGAVVALTGSPEISPDDYYARFRALPLALMVKKADLASNLAPELVAQLDEATRVRLAANLPHALQQLGVRSFDNHSLACDPCEFMTTMPGSSS